MDARNVGETVFVGLNSMRVDPQDR